MPTGRISGEYFYHTEGGDPGQPTLVTTSQVFRFPLSDLGPGKYLVELGILFSQQNGRWRLGLEVDGVSHSSPQFSGYPTSSWQTVPMRWVLDHVEIRPGAQVAMVLGYAPYASGLTAALGQRFIEILAWKKTSDENGAVKRIAAKAPVKKAVVTKQASTGPVKVAAKKVAAKAAAKATKKVAAPKAPAKKVAAKEKAKRR